MLATWADSKQLPLRRVCTATASLRQSRLKQTTAQATSTNANHRPASRSQRTPSRRQQLNQDSDRSTFERCRPSRADDSTPTPGDPRPGPTPARVRAVGRAVRGLVSVDRAGSSAPLPRRRADRRNVLHDRLEHGGVIDVGGSDHGGQRQPTAVADQMELGSRLATIDRICAHVVPPRLARTQAESTLARDQSSRPAAPSWSKTLR
jgi:hypothetical protein